MCVRACVRACVRVLGKNLNSLGSIPHGHLTPPSRGYFLAFFLMDPSLDHSHTFIAHLLDSCLLLKILLYLNVMSLSYGVLLITSVGTR